MKKSITLLAIIATFTINSEALDTLNIVHKGTQLKIAEYLYSFEDTFNVITIHDILANSKVLFKKPNDLSFNYGFSQSTYWFVFIVRNRTTNDITYILDIANPDIDHISFHEIFKNQVYKKFETGELHDVRSRDVYHRNFLFTINLTPDEVKTYYFSINNGGHSLFMPINLIEKEDYNIQDNKTELFYWLIYGVLIFIFIFNMYLYFATHEIINLNYSLYIFFLIGFLMYYDGYNYLINPSIWLEKTKYFFPAFYAIFLISFTQNFISSEHKFKLFEKIATPLKFIVFLLPFLYFFKYPIFLVCDIGAPLIALLTIVIIIVTAIFSFKKGYSPSILFLIGYCLMFLGIFFHELKELKVLEANFLTDNSIKIGFTLECSVLTFAILERFRIGQEKAKETIHESYLRIEGQNQELEIINTELEKLSIVASETNNGIAIYDKKGRLEWCNFGFEKFYEFNHGELIASNADHIDSIVPNQNIKSFFTSCLDQKKPVSFETKVITKKNKQKWVQTTLTPYPRTGNISKVIAIDSNITDLKNYESQLETAKEKAVESDRLKTVFLGNMSHEIRTPLNGILGFTELLSRTAVPDDRKERYYNLIMSNGEQLLRIIDDIVDISLIESNQLKMDESFFDLNTLINEVTDFFEIYKTSINKSAIQLILQNEVRHSPCMVNTDPIRLKQVLMNLIKNCFKFTTEGYIKIECLSLHSVIRFVIEDTGIGIDPEKSDLIFSRFRQGDESLSRKYGGTGLGLSISKGIIEKMDGKIWIDKEYQTGLRICFEIPYIQNSKEDDPLKDEYENNQYRDILKHKNFLIVEDDDTSFELLTEFLMPFDINITHAYDGVEAVEYVKQSSFDLILMDINLPMMDGVKATKEIRKFNSSILILAQTAYAMKIEKDNILAAGCNDIICKPINMDELFNKISFHLTQVVKA